MKHISVKAPDLLVQDVDECLQGSRYNGRSELVRDLLRKWVDNQRVTVRQP